MPISLTIACLLPATPSKNGVFGSKIRLFIYPLALSGRL